MDDLSHLLSNLAGVSDDEFIARTYTAVLGRGADRVETSKWAASLCKGATRGSMIRIIRKAEADRALVGSPEAEARALAALLFEPRLATALVPFVAWRMRGYKDPDVVWRAAEEFLDRDAGRLDRAVLETVLGPVMGCLHGFPVVGWLDGYKDGAVAGWASAAAGTKVEIALNGTIVGSAQLNVHRVDVVEAGLPGLGFRWEVDETRFPEAELTAISASMDSVPFPPHDRVHSPWLSRALPIFEQSGIGKFSAFQTAAFQSTAG